MEFSKITRQYWTEDDLLKLEQAESYREMFDIALLVLKRMPQPVGQVCGPISTGGRGSLVANLVAFNETIILLQSEGKHIFDQMLFEVPMSKIKSKIVGKYDESLLTDFYLPIFESGLVKKFYFLPDWQSSHGANWEHKQAQRLGIEIEYLK